MKKKVIIGVGLGLLLCFVILAAFLGSKSKGGDVVAIKKEWLELSPYLNKKYFYEPRPGFSIPEPMPSWYPQKPVHHVGSNTLNEQKDYSEDKPVGVFRILVLGASAFGYGVDTKDNYTELLETWLNSGKTCEKAKDYEVINLGGNGYDLTYEVERYSRRGKFYEPDLVIWAVSNDEFSDIVDLTFLKKKAYKDALDKDQKRMQSYQKQGEYSPWKLLAEQDLVKHYGAAKILDYQKRALGMMDRYYRGPLLFIPLGGTKSEYVNLIKEYVKSHPKAKVMPVLPKLTSLDGIFPDGVVSQKGHLVIAQKLEEYLGKQALLPCQ